MKKITKEKITIMYRDGETQTKEVTEEQKILLEQEINKLAKKNR